MKLEGVIQKTLANDRLDKEVFTKIEELLVINNFSAGKNLLFSDQKELILNYSTERNDKTTFIVYNSNVCQLFLKFVHLIRADFSVILHINIVRKFFAFECKISS